MPDFDRLINREGTHSVKYDLRKEVFGKADVIPMWVSDMDFAMPQYVAEALKKRIEHGILGYSFRNEGFANAITNWLQRRHGVGFDTSSVCFSPGIVSALVVILETFTNKSDKILIQPPVYNPFFEVPIQNQRQVVWNELVYEGRRYHMDFDKLAKQLKEVRMVILSNPHIPVSRVWTEDELEKFGQLCLENQVIIVSDEIHSDLMLGGHRHTPLIKACPELAPYLITCYAPSKTFNLAGLSTSAVLISNPSMREQYNHTLQRLHMQMGNVLGQVAFEAAYSGGEAWLSELLDYPNATVTYIEKRIRIEFPWLSMSKPEATYLLWLDFRKLGLSAEVLNRKLIEQCGLGLSRGDQFGPGGTGFMRMNITAPRSVINEAFERLKFLKI